VESTRGAIATGLRPDIAFQVIVDGIINAAQHYPEYRRKIETLFAEAVASADRGVGRLDIAEELLRSQQECRIHEQEDLHLNEQLNQGVDGTSCSGKL
jgi:hypothetical protein